MQRTFSVIRRRAGIVDILTPRVGGVEGYRFKAATNFDAPFATILTSTNVGFLDDVGVDRRVIESQPTDGQVRIVFNPTTYGLTDDAPFWLEFFQVTGGVETQVSAPTLVMPDLTQFLSRGYGHVLVRGSAPNGAGVANSLQLDLPRLMTDWRVYNEDAAVEAFIAFEPKGAEFALPVPSPQYQFASIHAKSASIWIRGAGGTPTLSIYATVANPT